MEAVDFLMRVLAELGYTPELTRCARCGGRLPAEGLSFSALAGGVIGPECQDPAAPTPPISARGQDPARAGLGRPRPIL